MKDFIAIDFETGNPQRVSACAIGYAKVFDCKFIEAKGYLIKPIGGHAPFQSKIHGITDEHTFDKPVFGELFPEIKDIFNLIVLEFPFWTQMNADCKDFQYKELIEKW